MSDFKSKYHKYKLKYLQLGGDDTESNLILKKMLLLKILVKIQGRFPIR